MREREDEEVKLQRGTVDRKWHRQVLISRGKGNNWQPPCNGRDPRRPPHVTGWASESENGGADSNTGITVKVEYIGSSCREPTICLAQNISYSVRGQSFDRLSHEHRILSANTQKPLQEISSAAASVPAKKSKPTKHAHNGLAMPFTSSYPERRATLSSSIESHRRTTRSPCRRLSRRNA